VERELLVGGPLQLKGTTVIPDTHEASTLESWRQKGNNGHGAWFPIGVDYDAEETDMTEGAEEKGRLAMMRQPFRHREKQQQCRCERSGRLASVLQCK
jgi:transposase-like protein